MSEHQISGNIDSFNIKDSFNKVWKNCTIADEDSEILAWLSPLEPQTRHHDIRTRRVDEVGDWFLQTEEYRNWFGGIRGGKPVTSALFCYGGPGVGKTYISSLVIDTLCKEAVVGNAGVACFYFDFAAQKEQSPAAILGSVLKQVVGGLNEVPEKIVKVFRDRKKVIGGQRLALTEIVGFLQDIASTRRTFICMDGLDEYPPGYRVRLLDSLNKILQSSPGAQIFLTGRPHIRGEVEKHLTSRVATRPITPTKKDIIIFLQAKLKEDAMPDAMDESLEEEIIQKIPEMVSEIFLLVFLSIKTILQEATIYRRRQKLTAIGNGLDLGGAYGATLGRIKAQGGEMARLGMAVLGWISHSRRPLKVDEMCHAIAIEIGSNGLNNDDIPAISTLLDCCQGLVTVDKGGSTIRFIHFTLQEYLCAHPELFTRADSTMAETCLTYLGFQDIKDLAADPPPDPLGAPFLEYSSLYWGTHMRMEPSHRARTFALELLGPFENHVSAKLLWNSISREFSSWNTDHKPFSALHCISYFGIADIADNLLKVDKRDVNQRDSAGVTPLIWAARYGHEKVVRLLLRKKDVQPDLPDTNSGRTALSWAAENGHEGVVRLFLRPRFVNPARTGRWWGRAPRVAGLLLSRRYVNPDSSSKSDQRPLAWAAENGHEGIVKLLLEQKNVNPDTPDLWSGQTALLRAAGNGHEGIVKLLLERRDVKPDTPDTINGQTPLSWAAENGHEGTTKLLLGRRDVKPNTPDLLFSRTPLSRAAGNGHDGVVELLLERKDVKPDTPDMIHGQTPLSWAARNGHEGSVKLLLARDDVNSDTPDTKYGRTPLLWASQNGHEGTVRLLLGWNDVNPNTPDAEFGQTPLSWAAESGHEGVVKLLLGRTDVNPDAPDTWYAQTPLSWAAENGHEGTVRLLLGRKDVNPGSTNKSGRTPLALAAANSHDRVVELLQTPYLERSGNSVLA